MADQAAIDAVVNSLAAAGGDLTAPNTSGHASYIYDQGTDTFTQTGAAPAEGMTQKPILDTGRDLQAAVNEITGNVISLEAKLAEVSYDSTGKASFAVQGRAREVLEIQAKQARISAEYDISRLNLIHAQRAAQGAQPEAALMPMADGRSLSLSEAAAREAYVSGAPPGQRVAYGQAYDKALSEQLLKNVARSVAATRR